jgi:hypothetical protein
MDNPRSVLTLTEPEAQTIVDMISLVYSENGAEDERWMLLARITKAFPKVYVDPWLVRRMNDGRRKSAPPQSAPAASSPQPIEKITKELLFDPLPGAALCGHSHPQAPHITCTLASGHSDMHTQNGMLMWDSPSDRE